MAGTQLNASALVKRKEYARCFVALQPPLSWCRAAWQELHNWSELRQFRAVPWRYWHLTLSFLGDVPLPLLADLAAAVAVLPASPQEPLVCATTEYWARPRVIVQSGAAAPEVWHDYAALIRARLAPFAPLQHQAFWTPHVTLVRGVGRVPESLPILPPCAWRQPATPQLFRSWLSPSGAHYAVVRPQNG